MATFETVSFLPGYSAAFQCHGRWQEGFRLWRGPHDAASGRRGQPVGARLAGPRPPLWCGMGKKNMKKP